MVLGVGVDLLDTRRVEQELAEHRWSLDDGVFTAQEIRYCSAARNPAIWYAACFAAKEATLKALGIPGTDLRLFREVEVRFLKTQQNILLHERLKARSISLGVRHIRLSLAPNSINAGAIVVLES